ncbi:MAG: hypothetical protein KF852_16600 [Saprospiraceae bacterium]|nr:hypothetical protein [Saprospiraceae bacterium]
MQRVSSNLTLFLLLFFPVFSLTILSAFTIAVWSYRFDYYGALSGPVLRIGVLIFLGLMLAVFYLTVWRLKRVELDEQFFYVTNYFRHVRYPYHQVNQIKITDWGLFRTIRISLKSPGSFGRHIVFLPSGRVLEDFAASRPELASKLAPSNRSQ